jgi:hypothetical protein
MKITDKDQILDWVKGINTFDEYRNDYDYKNLEWVESVLRNHMEDWIYHDESDNSYYHNPISKELYEIQDDDYEYISKKLVECMIQRDLEAV